MFTLTFHTAVTYPDGSVVVKVETKQSAGTGGYADVADLQRQARHRWHDPSYSTVTNIQNGVRREYVTPRHDKFKDYTLSPIAVEITIS